MKKTKMKIVLDEEEQEISEAIDLAIDKGILKSVENLERECSFAKEAALNYLRENATEDLLSCIASVNNTINPVTILKSEG